MEVKVYGDELPEVQLDYVVILIKENDNWVLVRHRDRQTWEFAGGHIEPGESPDEAAARELYEETGAEQYELHSVCVYSVEAPGIPLNYGMLYIATVQAYGPLPPYEMAEIKRFHSLPAEVTYPLIYPVLFAKVNRFLADGAGAVC